MSQFKPGDLALIIGSTGRRPELIGTTIELVARRISYSGQVVWEWMDEARVEHTAERHLMPLKGDFAPELQKSQEVSA